MSDILREMRERMKQWSLGYNFGKIDAAEIQRWADHLERVEADLRESDRRYQALEQRLHEMEDEWERLRGLIQAASLIGKRANGDIVSTAQVADDMRQLLLAALSPTTDDQEQSDES